MFRAGLQKLRRRVTVSAWHLNYLTPIAVASSGLISTAMWPTNQSIILWEQHCLIPRSLTKRESIQPQFNFCYHANSLSLNGNDWARIHGLMNLALAQRQRRDIVGPRSPLSPFKLTGK